MEGGNLSETEQKIVALTSLINSDGNTAVNLAERATLFNEIGCHAQAVGDAKAALALDSDCVEAYVAAGRAFMHQKRYEESYNYYKNALTVGQKNDVIKEDLKNLQNIILEDFEQQSQSIPEKDYSAVEFCSQEYYPDDNIMYRNEVEILAAKYKVVAFPKNERKEVSIKMRKEAASVGVMAFNCRERGQLDEALHFCTEAIQKDGANDRLLQMRAEIFYQLDNDKMALQDLMTIPKPNRVLDVWKLGGRILTKYELPVMAEFWLRKATALSPKKDEEAARLFQKVRVKRLYDPLAAGYPVTIEFREYGRSVFATEKLSEGEDAFDDFPVVLGKLRSCLHLPGCHQCGMALYTQKDFFNKSYETMPTELRDFVDANWPDVAGVSCEKCNREQYCNEICRKIAWDTYHAIICPAVNEFSSELYDLIDRNGFVTDDRGVTREIWYSQYSPIIMAKIWGQIISEAKRLMKVDGADKISVENWARAKTIFRKFIAFGTSQDGVRLPEVHVLMKRIFADCGDGVTFDISDTEFESRFLQATCNLQAFSSSVTPHVKFLEKLSTVQDIRAIRVLKLMETETPPTVSYAGMFPLHACLNHSCDNNVEVMDGNSNGKPAVHVRVIKEIKPDEEIFTTYIDTGMPRKLRRAWLYKSFNFWCFCRRCTFEGDDNTCCTHCKKFAERGKIFKGCSRCKRAWYCSTKCQKENWVKGHKGVCGLSRMLVES